VNPQPAKWLRVVYAPPDRPTVPLGVVLYCSDADELRFRFRQDMSVIEPEDRDVVAGLSSTFETIAIEQGARATFEWMESSLSNIVRAEGPFSVSSTISSANILTELYNVQVESA
jgi:hypothetical protein